MQTTTIPSFILITTVAFSLPGCVGKDQQIEEAKRTLESTLADPGSIQYQNVQRFADGTVCGQYNVKNRVGGYTGLEPFIYRDGALVSRKQLSDNVSTLCSNDAKKTEVSEHKVSDIEFNVSESDGKRKTASVNVFLYIDVNNSLLVLDKSDAIRARIKRVFDGRAPKELEGDQLRAALLKELVSDKELTAIRDVRYVVWQ